MSDSDDDSLALDTIFTEPPRPSTPEPTLIIYRRNLQEGELSEGEIVSEVVDESQWTTIEIQLIGTHPLWAHHLWNAARAFASYLDTHRELYRNGAVLELGAGGGLPGIVCAKNGARRVVLTDYPDAPLLKVLQRNVERNIPTQLQSRVHVQGYIWGHPIEPLLEVQKTGELEGYDIVIMSDLVFNHSQHDALLKTCKHILSMKRTSSQSAESRPNTEQNDVLKPSLLVFYSHHRPHLAHRDMEFLEKAKAQGWQCDKVVTQKFPPMFPEDPGDEEVRAMVHGWRLTRSQ
ncbi:nicotinamide N-methyltransferase [Amylocystis lapponica]|nr:nicotinamide N-methyltransferase [Amylocystis lapponica]